MAEMGNEMSDSARDLSSREALLKIIQGEGLSRGETEELFGSLMDGELTDVTKAALLAALAVKGESVDEVAGAVEAMRSRVVSIPTDRHNVVDTCGTGGDSSGTFNISTAAAFVAAAAGVPIAKHGNRSVSSRSGSADVLEALGVELEMKPHDAASALEQIGIAFLYAPRLHPAMREVMQIRRDLGVRTIFNILGPLTNPAGARRQVVGVFEDRLVGLVADVLVKIGCDHALVVRGSDGLDELTTTGETMVSEVRDGSIDSYVVLPESFGLQRVDSSVLKGGDPSTNADLMIAVLGGESSPLSDITVLNAGAAIYVGGLTTSLEEGVEQARRTIGSGSGLAKLEELRDFSAGADGDSQGA